MNKMKIDVHLLLILLAVLALLFSFTACDNSSGSSDASNTYTEDDGVSEDESTSDADTSVDDDLEVETVSTVEVCTEEGLAYAFGLDGVTILLLNDIELTEAVSVTGEDIILDMDGKAIYNYVYDENAITITGSLTITGDGTITNKFGNSKFFLDYMIYVNGGSLTIESGTFLHDEDNEFHSAKAWNNILFMIY